MLRTYMNIHMVSNPGNFYTGQRIHKHINTHIVFNTRQRIRSKININIANFSYTSKPKLLIKSNISYNFRAHAKHYKQEEEIVSWARESVVSTQNIAKGTVIGKEMIAIKRPSPSFGRFSRFGCGRNWGAGGGRWCFLLQKSNRVPVWLVFSWNCEWTAYQRVGCYIP